MEKQAHQRRRAARSRSRSEQTPWARTTCKAPRLDNRQLMEEHRVNTSDTKKTQSEFMDLWLDQLEETTRQMPHESLLQRVLELESELLDTQEKLKKANKDLLRQHGKTVSAPSSPLYCASPRNSPMYQSPRLISPSVE